MSHNAPSSQSLLLASNHSDRFILALNRAAACTSCLSLNYKEWWFSKCTFYPSAGGLLSTLSYLWSGFKASEADTYRASWEFLILSGGWLPETSITFNITRSIPFKMYLERDSIRPTRYIHTLHIYNARKHSCQFWTVGYGPRPYTACTSNKTLLQLINALVCHLQQESIPYMQRSTYRFMILVSITNCFGKCFRGTLTFTRIADGILNTAP